MVTGARRIGAVGLLVAAALLVLTPAAGRAQELQEIALERFKVKPATGAKPSTVEAGAIVLRQYSTVRCEGVGLEAAEIGVQAEWLKPLDNADLGVKLHFIYDDEVAENVECIIPRGSRHNELVYKPKWASGRRIQALELSGGGTGTEVKITSMKLAVRRTAITMASSVLGGARLVGEGLTNDILIARWNTPREKLPALVGVNAPEIRLVASTSCGFPWVLEKSVEVPLLAMAADGKVLKFIRFRADGNARPITISLKDVDLTKVARLAFAAAGTNVNLAVRQITIGAGTSGLTLKEVNDRFQALLERSRKEKSISESALAQLAGLLDLYRALE